MSGMPDTVFEPKLVSDRIPETTPELSESALLPIIGMLWLQVAYVTQECLRFGNEASGPDVGRILVGKASKSALRPAEPAGVPILRLSQ